MTHTNTHDDMQRHTKNHPQTQHITTMKGRWAVVGQGEQEHKTHTHMRTHMLIQKHMHTCTHKHHRKCENTHTHAIPIPVSPGTHTHLCGMIDDKNKGSVQAHLQQIAQQKKKYGRGGQTVRGCLGRMSLCITTSRRRRRRGGGAHLSLATAFFPSCW